MLWHSSPRWTVIGTILMVLEIGFGLALLFWLKRLVDVMTGTLAGDAGLVGEGGMLGYVALTGGCALAFMVCRGMAGLAREAQGLQLADHLDSEIHDRAVKADLAFYESPRYADTLQRAREAGNQRPVQVISNILLLAKNGLMLAAVAGLIMTIDWRLLPLMLCVILPALWVRLRYTRRLYDWQVRRTQMERRAGYLDWLMTSEYHAKELRLNQLGAHLRKQYAELRGRIRRERFAITQRRTWIELAVGGAATLAFFGALTLLVWQAVEGHSSVGDLVLFLLIFQRTQSMGQELVQQISRLYEDHLYMGQLLAFLDIRPALADPEQPLPVPVPPVRGIRFENVTFRYPDSEREALQAIDLTIRPGEVVALVGANGSGKTTLIKLLCRLYDPSAGRITLDGVDIRDYGIVAYRRLFSVVFQDYAHYATTARENIRFGDIDQPPDTPSVQSAAELAGAASFIDELAHGYETRLTRMFDDGMELSIGQWQKIALARAFMRQSQFIVLDEPTSALDPGAEFALFENFRERVDHRGALIISHRLSSVRMADCIHVLDQGRILESGSHDELMERKGAYFELFRRQAYHYREGNSEESAERRSMYDDGTTADLRACEPFNEP
ncbi:ABC transporter ATP-binding protein [Aidingimonas halophila]|uniref:ATP-binding cassette, subfamily B n=1 Tax=Aidingimonas halophila TaxID=574349 RepID=A0A1H3G6E8_9GAMM|nr:ABC transporter ATP-binding protein [Aidingimonas halophila]GHC32523.1 ABC transporter permease [Aidingimonas halophila]SDX98198.1 ATP-binding cassette, subfamily B [Aidingimonas halophila]